MYPNYGMQLLRQNAQNLIMFRTRNRWMAPQGEDLKKEYNLVLEKKSNLSRKQRDTVVYLYLLTLKLEENGN